MMQVLCQFCKNITIVRAQENTITYSFEEDRKKLTTLFKSSIRRVILRQGACVGVQGVYKECS